MARCKPFTADYSNKLHTVELTCADVECLRTALAFHMQDIRKGVDSCPELKDVLEGLQEIDLKLARVPD